MKRSKEESKNAIIDAASKLFISQGIAGVKVSDIAEASGIDACMINHHFGSKEGLIETVIGKALTRWEAIDMRNYYNANKSLLSFRNGQKAFISGLVERVFSILDNQNDDDPCKCMLLQLLQYPGELRSKIIKLHIQPLFTTFFEIYRKITGLDDYEDAFCWFLILVCPQYVNMASPGLMDSVSFHGKVGRTFSRRLQFITTQILLSGLGLAD